MDFPANSFRAFEEPLVWRQDKAPHMTGTFSGVVLHGAPDSQSAGNTLSPQLADPWTVTVERHVALIAGIKVGDTLKRVGIDAETLTVQQIARDAMGWLLTCTANERPPL